MNLISERDRHDYTEYAHLKKIEFNKLVDRLIEVEDQKKELADQERKLRIELGIALDVAGVDSVLCNDMPVTLVEGKGRKSLDQKKLQQGLISRGVAPEVIAQAFNESTKVGKPTVTVKVFRKKGK